MGIAFDTPQLVRELNKGESLSLSDSAMRAATPSS
jgi:hypothetical protein